MSSNLETHRKQVDHIDESIIKLLAERQAVAQKIGQIKKQEGKVIIDPHREASLAQLHHDLSVRYGLDPTLVQPIFELIISASRKVQET